MNEQPFGDFWHGRAEAPFRFRSSSNQDGRTWMTRGLESELMEQVTHSYGRNTPRYATVTVATAHTKLEEIAVDIER